MRGKKTSPDVVYQVMVSWAETNSYSETGKLLNLATNTVKGIVNANKDKEVFAKLLKEKREEFVNDATRIIGKAMRRLENSIDNEEEYIPINQLTTAIGTLYDKRALAKGESTSNTAVTFTLPDEVSEYAE